ncbi:MAG: hypothetical protein ABJD53_16695 [Gammaproteobacteria bacterium]
MTHVNVSFPAVLAAAVWFGVLCGASVGRAAADAAAAPTADVVSGEWQHRKLTFNYVGFTAAYTCDGLEDHVRLILLNIGARKDLKVTATGCPGPFNSPSHSAFVNVDFYALAAATDAPGTEMIKAHWTPLELTPQRPNFMGGGDCELIQGMKDLITNNFALRSVEYRTSCFPNQVTLNGFSVKGQALRALPSAVTG